MFLVGSFISLQLLKKAHWMRCIHCIYQRFQFSVDPSTARWRFRVTKKYLAGHSTELHTLVTTVYHDSKSTVPKYFFKPSRPLSLEETEQVEQILDSDDVKQALLFNRVVNAQPTFEAVDGFTVPTDNANSLRGF